MTRDDVIDVLSVVAAATRRSIGETDVDIWAAVIGGDDKDLAMRAVRDHLAEQPGVWLEPGHIHQRVRAIVRDQHEREPLAVKAARMEALESKAAEDIAELAERKGIPTTPKYTRTPAGKPNPLSIPCPWCHASPGQRCHIPKLNKPLTKRRFHDARIEAAQNA